MEPRTWPLQSRLVDLGRQGYQLQAWSEAVGDSHGDRGRLRHVGDGGALFKSQWRAGVTCNILGMSGAKHTPLGNL